MEYLILYIDKFKKEKIGSGKHKIRNKNGNQIAQILIKLKIEIYLSTNLKIDLDPNEFKMLMLLGKSNYSTSNSMLFFIKLRQVFTPASIL